MEALLQLGSIIHYSTWSSARKDVGGKEAENKRKV